MRFAKSNTSFKNRFALITLMLSLPLSCYADGGVKALEGFINLFINFQYFLTFLSAYFLFKFYRKRLNRYRLLAIAISILVIIFSIPTRLIVDSSAGLFLFFSNITLIMASPWAKAYPHLKIVIGRLDDDKRIITWLSLRRVSSEMFEVSTHKVLDEWNSVYKSFSTFAPVNSKNGEESIYFESFQEGVDYIAEKYNLEASRIVKERNLQSGYRRLLAKEERLTES